MPLFKSRSSSSEKIAQSEADISHANHETQKHRSPSAFRARHSPPPTAGNTTPPTRRSSLLSRFRENPSRSLKDDPAIKAAQQKVSDAVHAERDADKALEVAKSAVRAARHHVKELEEAAMEEAKRARAKQQQAKTIRKGADRLGRHDHH